MRDGEERRRRGEAVERRSGEEERKERDEEERRRRRGNEEERKRRGEERRGGNERSRRGGEEERRKRRGKKKKKKRRGVDVEEGRRSGACHFVRNTMSRCCLDRICCQVSSSCVGFGPFFAAARPNIIPRSRQKPLEVASKHPEVCLKKKSHFGFA